MNLKEKISYLKGFYDGKENKDLKTQEEINKKIFEILDNMATEIEKLSNAQMALANDFDDMALDLENLEDYVYDDDYDYDDYPEDDFYEDDKLVLCPKCGTCLEIEEEDNLDELVCPNCNHRFTLEEGLDAFDKDEEENE